MRTNPHGVEYKIEPDGEVFSVVVRDVTTPVSLTGFATRKCAENYALELQPIINKELLHDPQTTL